MSARLAIPLQPAASHLRMGQDELLVEGRIIAGFWIAVLSNGTDTPLGTVAFSHQTTGVLERGSCWRSMSPRNLRSKNDLVAGDLLRRKHCCSN